MIKLLRENADTHMERAERQRVMPAAADMLENDRKYIDALMAENGR